MLRPYKLWRSSALRSGGAGYAVFEEGDKLLGIAGGREAGLAGADYGERFAGWEMRESFLESAGEMELRSFRCDAEEGFAEAEDAVAGGFESLRSGIVCGAGDYDLQRMMGEERGSQAVGGGEEAVLWGDAGEGFESFLGEGAVAVVAGEGVQSN